MEKEFERYNYADRYLAILYDFLHERIYYYHVRQTDETPVLVNKDGRTAGAKNYMWVYRTGKMLQDKQIVLYVADQKLVIPESSLRISRMSVLPMDIRYITQLRKGT